METVLERFLRYVKIDTQSDSNTGTHPSTAKQFDLLNLLVKDLLMLLMVEMKPLRTQLGCS